MGSDAHYPEEAPAHPVTVSGFWIDRTQVTNAAFRRFVKATGYVTVAERVPDAALYPGRAAGDAGGRLGRLQQPAGRVPLHNHYNWWDWNARRRLAPPGGSRQQSGWQERHPVLHVAWEDVAAYAAWAGKEIPTEAEWEYAAGAGTKAGRSPGATSWRRRGKMLANYWQGEFPWQNLELDGYERTAPVGCFPPNGYGLFDMIGNAWEWTTDWYAASASVAVPAAARPSIREAEPGRRASIRTLPEPPSPAGAQGRLVRLRRELLPALPPRRPHAPPDRHRHTNHLQLPLSVVRWV